MARWGLVRLVSKQLAAIVDLAVAVSVQAKERVVGTRSRPSYRREFPGFVYIEVDSMSGISQSKPIACHVD
jgi:hypothetical protein